MANYIKRLKGWIAPVLVIYTVLVTYFLAQTAWDDVSKTLKRHNDFRFWDVLEQEERRHLRSFQDVVHNYRGVVQIEIRDKVDVQKLPDDAAINDQSNLNNNSDIIISEPDPGQAMPGGSKFQDPDHYAYDNDDEDIDDLRILEQKRHSKNHHKGHGQNFQVEVEEWDEHAKQPRPAAKGNGHYKSAQNSGHFVSEFSNKAQYKQGNSPQGDGFYTTEYCDKVFENSGSHPPICNHELAEFGTDKHIVNSKYFLPFRQLGGIFIYSAFLDVRKSPMYIRIISVGEKDHGNSKSVYWCVFYTPLQSEDVDYRLKFSNSSKEVNAKWSLKQNKQATQMSYYTASDGHKKDNQFYIMSCPVPESAMKSLLPPHHGLIQLVVGSLEQPMLDTVQESLTMKVIINTQTAPDADFGTASRHKRSYFDEMENSLSSLNVSAIKSGAEERNNYQNHGNINRDDNARAFLQNNHTAADKGENVRSNNNGVLSINSNSVLNQNVSSSKNVNTNNSFNIISPNNSVIETVHTQTETKYSQTSSPPQDSIVACVAPLQGNIGPIQMVEFIELTLLLGSQHIVFYTFRVLDEVKNLLKMYEERGLITVMPWNLPAPNSIWAKGRDVALNDCLYRSMLLYDYALFLDLDEFFVPHVTSDLQSFMKYLRAVHKFNSTRFSDLVFSSAYFPPPTKLQYKNLTTVPDFTRDVNKFTTLRSVHRTYYNPQHTLRMVKPIKAIRVGAGERKRTSFTISSRFAAVNHFSYCPQDAGVSKSNNNLQNSPYLANGSQNGTGQEDGKKPGASEKSKVDICSHTKADWVMWRYKTKLIERTKESIRKLNRGG